MMDMTTPGMMGAIYDAAELEGSDCAEDGTPIYTFRITSPTVDRQGEVVTTDGWRFDAYLRNPVVLNSHDYTDIEAIVGRCVAINRDGDSWTADLRFNSTEYGCLAKELIDCGDLRAVSVGFRPIVIEYPDVPSLRAARTLTDAQEKALVNVAQDPGTAIRHVEKELLEISVVPVPANPDAIRLRSLAAMAAPVVAKAVAPQWMRSNARQGIAWYEAGKAGDGVTGQTVREAREMASGTVTADKAGRMAAWFARHMVDLDAPSAKPGHPDYPSPGVVAHALWGGGTRAESERAMAWAQANSQERGMDSITAKGAIPYRKTPLAPESQSWDGPGETTKATVDDLKVMCAWVDSSKPDIESSYKLAHHVAGGDHACVWRGVAQCMSIMFGGRGGVDMPEGDRKAVYDHLAGHYRDFNKPAPAWKSIEDGTWEGEDIETKAADEQSWPGIAAAMYGVITDTEADDTTRRRLYVALERAYRVLDRVPPEFVPAETVAKWPGAVRDGHFWEGEADHVVTRAGRTLSSANEQKLRQAMALINEVLTTLPQAPEPAAPVQGDSAKTVEDEALQDNLAALAAWLEIQR